MSNKSYAYLLNVKPSNLVFLKTYNTEFDQIIIPFMDQNVRPLETEEEINSTFLLMWHSIQPKQKNMLNNMDFYCFWGNIEKIIGYRTRCCKNCFQIIVDKT